MDFFGIGIPEIIYILLLALIILGPRDLEKVGRSIGNFLRRIVFSPEWRAVRDTSKQIREIPNQLIRESREDLQEAQTEFQELGTDLQQNLRESDIEIPSIGIQQETPSRPKGPVAIPQGKATKPETPNKQSKAQGK